MIQTKFPVPANFQFEVRNSAISVQNARILSEGRETNSKLRKLSNGKRSESQAYRRYRLLQSTKLALTATARSKLKLRKFSCADGVQSMDHPQPVAQYTKISVNGPVAQMDRAAVS